MAPSSLHRRQYDVFRALLIETRKAAQLTQQDVAQALGKPQSFISKYERGERRLDFTEAMEIWDVMNIDPHRFIERYLEKIGQLIKQKTA